MTIYVSFPLTESEQALLSEAGSDSDVWIFAQHLPETQRPEAFLRAEVAFGNVPLPWLEQTRTLRWLQLYSAGLNPYQVLQGRDLPFVVTNLRDFFGWPVAETAVSGILAMYRKLDELIRLQSRRQWVGGVLRPQMQLLHEKNVLILGSGAIGSTIRQILSGFHCTVEIISRSAAPTLSDLDALLPQTDIVIGCLPGTEETTGVFDARRFRLMKPSALLVNVGRGSLVDEDALLQALAQGTLGGAVLDVTLTEPLPPAHPLWTHERVLLTQHTSGGYAAENVDKIRVFTENLTRYRQGLPLQNLVNLTRGY